MSQSRKWEDIIGASSNQEGWLKILNKNPKSAEKCPWEFIFILRSYETISDMLFGEMDGMLREYKSKLKKDTKKPYLFIFHPKDKATTNRQKQSYYLEKLVAAQYDEIPKAFFQAADQGKIYQHTMDYTQPISASLINMKPSNLKIKKFKLEINKKDAKNLQEDFQKHLKNLKKKAINLDKRKYPTAARAARNLYDTLKTNSEAFFNNQSAESYQEFKIQAESDIKNSRSELEKHRGIKRILINISLGIIGLGIFYLFAGLLHARFSKEKKFLFFNKTDSIKKVEKIQKTINKLKPG